MTADTTTTTGPQSFSTLPRPQADGGPEMDGHAFMQLFECLSDECQQIFINHFLNCDNATLRRFAAGLDSWVKANGRKTGENEPAPGHA